MDDRAELIRQIKKIDIATGVLVEGLQTGFHHSVFKGQGIEFTEIREYTPGDDIRAIDWKVTARYNRPFVKEFTEERDQTFYFVADISGSSGFGLHSTKKRKILEITASLAFAAVRNNDRVGLVLFSDRVEKFVPAKRGRKHLAELFNVMIDHRPVSKKTDLAAALQFLATVLARRSSIVILSDFASPSFSLPLRVLRRRHEVIAIRITDPREQDLPDVGFIELEDTETGEQVLADTSDPGFRQRYRGLVAGYEDGLHRNFARNCIPEVVISTDEPYDIPLKEFFTRVSAMRRNHAGIL
ncbi:DUF58 domain-containing protein [Methanoregula sp.]|uniref:DUF58 domain-containing protein n=1 Tax=Methanoregula sp. TaxID=2052170 RepID=UPI003BAE271A